MKYEYSALMFEANKPLHPGHLDHDQLLTRLNSEGALGWELVNIFTTQQSGGITHAVTAVFKRPLKSAVQS